MCHVVSVVLIIPKSQSSKSQSKSQQESVSCCCCCCCSWGCFCPSYHRQSATIILNHHSHHPHHCCRGFTLCVRQVLGSWLRRHYLVTNETVGETEILCKRYVSRKNTSKKIIRIWNVLNIIKICALIIPAMILILKVELLMIMTIYLKYN